MEAVDAAPGNAAAAISGLLGTLGIKNTAERATIETALARALQDRGLAADLVGVRHNVATLAADPLNAALLRYDLPHILDDVNAQVPEPVDQLVVKVARYRQETSRDH